VKDFWIRLPKWFQIMTFITASAGVLVLADKVLGQCYVWQYTVSPRVEKRVEPMERSADYLVSFIQATYPDSVIRRVDSTYNANIAWKARMRGER